MGKQDRNNAQYLWCQLAKKRKRYTPATNGKFGEQEIGGRDFR